MAATVTEQTVHMLEFLKEEEIAAPIDVVFETILEEMERLEGQGGTMPMKLEAWPGGRWFRDLGMARGTGGARCSRSSLRRCWRFAGLCLCRSQRSRMCSTD